MSTLNKDELIHEIGKMIVSDEEYSDDDWSAISVVGKFKGTSSRIQGYVYLEEGTWEAATPENLGFESLLQSLRDEMKKEAGGEHWKSCLIQIKRNDMSMNVKFDYESENTWTDDLSTLPDRLRPS